ADLGALAGAEALPGRGPVDRDDLVRRAERVVLVDLVRPVDPLRGVPLPVLALLVEVQQPVAALVVLPRERGGAAVRHVPARLLDGQGVDLCGHDLLPQLPTCLGDRTGDHAVYAYPGHTVGTGACTGGYS